MQDLEARLAQAQAVVAMVLLDADILGPAPAPTAAVPTVSLHSKVLSAEQIARARSPPHLGLLCSVFRGSRDQSQSRATSSVAQPMLRSPDSGHKGSGVWSLSLFFLLLAQEYALADAFV